MATTEEEISLAMRDTLFVVVDHRPEVLDTIVRCLVARSKVGQNRDACHMILQRIYRRLHDDADPVGRLHFHHWVIAHCQSPESFPAADVTDKDAEPAAEVLVQ